MCLPPRVQFSFAAPPALWYIGLQLLFTSPAKYILSQHPDEIAAHGHNTRQQACAEYRYVNCRGVLVIEFPISPRGQRLLLPRLLPLSLCVFLVHPPASLRRRPLPIAAPFAIDPLSAPSLASSRGVRPVAHGRKGGGGVGVVDSTTYSTATRE